MDNQEEADTSSEIAGLTIKTSEDEDTGLTKRQDDGEELLRGLVQFAVRLEIEVDIDEMSSSKKLSTLDLRLGSQVP